MSTFEHVLSARQFSTDELGQIFEHTDDMRRAVEAGRRQLATRRTGFVAATLFYEPSTRTRLSFESAAVRLGMGLISTENAKEFSSAIKGETIEDTVRVVGAYADTIVMRHHEDGTAEKAAAASKVPIINAGDGKNEHPTQALLDMYTIRREKGRLDNLHVVMGGDLKYGRTVRSLARLLSLYDNNHLSFVSVPELQMRDDITAHLDETDTSYTTTDDMFGVLHDADVVYWTRLQKERLGDDKDGSVESSFVIDQAALQAMSGSATIMHPLPRVGEIDESVDADPRAKYFAQAENGLYVRMALLDMLLENT